MILDINSRFYNSIEWMQELRNAKPAMKWLACSIHDELIIKTIQTGGLRYIRNENSPGGLKNLLYNIVRGVNLPSPPHSDSLNPAYRQIFKKSNGHRLLSGREKEILHFISRGLLYKEIGLLLGIQKGAVKKHVAKIYEKLQVQNKIEALNKFYGLVYQE
jgi:DNA-binding NarL/FixJ family response regulator